MAESLPVLHWQLHAGSSGAGYQASGVSVRIRLVVLLTNVAPGPTRVGRLRARTDEGQDLKSMIAIPTTLPTCERIELELWQQRGAGDYPGTRTVTIRLRYKDLHALSTYETRPAIVAHGRRTARRSTASTR